MSKKVKKESETPCKETVRHQCDESLVPFALKYLLLTDAQYYVQ